MRHAQRFRQRRDVDFSAPQLFDDLNASRVCNRAHELAERVCCEKPITRSIREGRQLADATKAKKRVFRTDSEFRSLANFHRVCELVRNGRIGKVHTVRVAVPKADVGCGVEPAMPVPPELDYEQYVRRFEMGTPALPTVHTALGGQEILSEIGADRVIERNQALTAYVIDRLGAAGFDLTVATDPESRTNIVMVRHPDPPGAVARLAEEGIIVDHRPGHVRVSPHFYNTTEELDRFVEALTRRPD